MEQLGNRGEIMRRNLLLIITCLRCFVAYLVAITVWFYIWDQYEFEWIMVMPLYVIGVIIITSIIIWPFGRRWRVNLIGLVSTVIIVFSSLHLYHLEAVTEVRNNNLNQHLTNKYNLSPHEDTAIEQSDYAIILRATSHYGPHHVQVYNQMGSKIADYSIADLVKQLETILPNLDTLLYKDALIQPTLYHGLRKVSGYAELVFETRNTTDNQVHDYGYKLKFKDGKLILNKDLYEEFAVVTFADPHAIPISNILDGTSLLSRGHQ
jgi:hypothetical protein